jgi:hypothetical protein
VGDFPEKITEQLPDVWYDWYARLLPGCFGIWLYLYLSSKLPSPPTGVQVAVFLLSGYTLGHVLQPFAGFIVKEAEIKLYDNERKYAKAKLNGVGPSVLNKVSKAHAEASSMLAFCFALLLNIFWCWNSPRLNRTWATACAIYFAAAALERIRARNRKINDLD